MENIALTTEPGSCAKTPPDNMWVRTGMRCKIRMAVGPKDVTPRGFATDFIEDGNRIGEVPVTVLRFCPDRCHAEVRLDDQRFSLLTVETEDLAPFGEA